MKHLKILTALILLAATLLFHSCKKDRTIVYVKPLGNTNPNSPDTTKSVDSTKKSYQINISSSWKAQAPASQKFIMDAGSWSMVQGKNGCTFYIPANALLDAANKPVTGNVDIELIEYMNKADMLFSGVTVTSGDELLESGGMFYLMAKQHGNELHLADHSGFSMDIKQANSNDEPMDIWTGEVNKKDSLNKVNWVIKDSAKLKPRNDSFQFNKSYNMQFDYFKFGYTNIDRHMSEFTNPVTTFKIHLPKGCNDTNSTALILFKKYNCCAWCGWSSAGDYISTHYTLPVGGTAKVLVYKKTGEKEDDLEYAIKEITFTADTELEFTTMTKCTQKELSDLIKTL